MIKLRRGLGPLTALTTVAMLGLAACGSGSSGGDTAAPTTAKAESASASESASAPADASSTPAGSDEIVIGVMLWNTEIPFYGRYLDALDDAAAKFDVKVDVRNGQGDLVEQGAIIDQFIAAKVDAMIVTPSDAEGIIPAVERANEAGIPVVAVNNRIGDGPDVLTFVGADDFEFGRKQGELLVNTIGEEGKVGLILGALGTSAQTLREDGLRDYLKDHPKVEIVDSQTANWAPEEAVAVAQDWMVRYGDGELTAIVDQGPEGVAAARAISDSGRSDIKVILGDYPSDVQTAIIDGLVAGTVNQDPYPQSFDAVEIIAAYLRDGTKPEAENFIELPLVTPDNAADSEPAWGS